MPDTTPDERKGDQHRRDAHDKATLIILTFTLIAAGCAAGFTGWQAWVARQQLAVASETELRQLRAYVGIDAIKLRPIANGSPVVAEITVKNYGVTPANLVRIINATTINSDRFSPENALGRTALSSSFSLFPGATKTQASFGETVNAWDLWQSAQSVESVLVVGRIEYATVFTSDQRPQRQTTRFCVDAYQKGAQTPDACQKYNEAD